MLQSQKGTSQRCLESALEKLISLGTLYHQGIYGKQKVKAFYLANFWLTTDSKEAILQSIIRRAQGIVQAHNDPIKGPPDPAFALQLPDEIYTGSNLYAIQKSFDGPFQFDVLFESASSKQELTSAEHLVLG
jgi:hypothetical protein